ncbi:hypothetical protein L9F63_013965, partial [Diploptera punctata]
MFLSILAFLIFPRTENIHIDWNLLPEDLKEVHSMQQYIQLDIRAGWTRCQNDSVLILQGGYKSYQQIFSLCSGILVFFVISICQNNLHMELYNMGINVGWNTVLISSTVTWSDGYNIYFQSIYFIILYNSATL